MLLVFAAFGITNPLVAKLMPEILKSLGTGGIVISVPEPTALDAWTQFFKNTTQIGFIVMVIIFSGTFSSELSKGTLVNLLTKGLSRPATVLSKYTAMVLLWTACIALCFGLTCVYTVYLFPDDEINNLPFSVFCLWLFGLFLLAVLLLSAALTGTAYGCLLLTGAVVASCVLINIIPEAKRYNPVLLASENMSLLTGTAEVSSYGSSIMITCIAAFAFVLLSVMAFRKNRFDDTCCLEVFVFSYPALVMSFSMMTMSTGSPLLLCTVFSQETEYPAER
jgi:hypothetical protein